MKETGIPYRAALKNIEVMENDLGTPIVVTKRGGKGGGGSSELSDIGKEILLKFIKMNHVLRKNAYLNEITGTIFDIDNEKKIMKVSLDNNEIILPLTANFNIEDNVLLTISPNNIFVTLKPQESSVRNTIEGTITEMQLKEDKVRLNINIGKNNIVVDVTELSRKELDLNLGKRVYIGFKAASVDIIKIE